MQTHTLFLKGRKRIKRKEGVRKEAKLSMNSCTFLAVSYVANNSFGLDCSDAVQLAASVSGLVGRNWKSCYNGLQAFISSLAESSLYYIHGSTLETQLAKRRHRSKEFSIPFTDFHPFIQTEYFSTFKRPPAERAVKKGTSVNKDIMVLERKQITENAFCYTSYSSYIKLWQYHFIFLCHCFSCLSVTYKGNGKKTPHPNFMSVGKWGFASVPSHLCNTNKGIFWFMF